MSKRTPTTRALVALAALLSAAMIAGGASPATAVTPPDPVIGTGTSGSVTVSPTLEPGESVAPTTGGLSPAELLTGENPAPAGRSGVTGEIDSLVLSQQVWVEDASMVRFETVVTDAAADLEMHITWIEQGDLDVGGEWTVDTGDVDRLDLPAYYGLWLVDVRQVGGPAGVAFDTTATVVRNSGAALSLSPAVVSADQPDVTASWSDLEPDRTYLATVDWGSPQQRSLVEVRTGEPVTTAVTTITSARLSSSLGIGTRPVSLITRVTPDGADSVPGELRLRVDGVVRSTTAVTATAAQVFYLRIPALGLGVHEVAAEFHPRDAVSAASVSPTRRLLVIRR